MATTEARMKQLTGAYADLNKSNMLVGEMAVPSDHVPVVRNGVNSWEDLLTSQSAGDIIALSETMTEQIESFEQLVIDRVGINDSTATLTQAYSGSKTQGLIDGVNTNLTAQIAQKAAQSDLNITNNNVSLKSDKTYVDAKFGTMGNTKVFKGSCTDVELAAKTGMVVDDYWYITDLDTNKSYNGTSWIDIGNSLKIADYSISPEKTSFAEIYNLFNKTDITAGGYHDLSGNFVANADFETSNLIPIQYGVNYITNVSTSYSNLCFYDKNGIFVSAISNNTWSGTFTVPNNSAIKYLKFAFRTTEDLEVLMLVKGSVLPSNYVPYGYAFPDSFIAFQEKDMVTGTVSRNIFNKDKVAIGYEVNSNGTIVVQAASAVTEMIAVKGKTLYLSGLPLYTGAMNRLGFFYNSSKTPIGTWVAVPYTVTEQAISIPSNAAYFRFSIYQRKTSAEVMNFDTVQIELNVKKTPYTSYMKGITKIKKYGLGNDSLLDPITLPTSDKNFLIFGDSITETATVSDDGVTYTEGTRSNWPTFSKTTLQMGQMWNYAKSGAAYKDRVGVLERQKISVQITTAIANSRPADIIVISCGTNDGNTSLGDYTTAMAKTTLASLDRTLLYEAVRWAFWTLRLNYPNAMCFCATPIQRADYEQSSELIDAITKMAHRYNFIIIDAYGESGIIKDFEVNGASGRYLSDGLHPSISGQQLMSNLFNRVILNSLNY